VAGEQWAAGSLFGFHSLKINFHVAKRLRENRENGENSEIGRLI
jgi:hypothetical protein